MRIYHIEFAKTGFGLSGGEKAMVEVIKYLKSKGVNNTLLTTDNGKDTYERLGLIEDNFLSYKVIFSYEQEQKRHIFVSYFLRTFKAVSLIKNIKLEKNDILMCHSDFFPNSIPMYILAKQNPSNKLFYWFHMFAPSIFKSYEGEFVGKYQFPKFNIIHYNLNQWLYRKLLPHRGVIITINNFYQKKLKELFSCNNIYVIKRFGGADVLPATSLKEYDIAWMGRFHQQKGLFELLKILSLVKEKKSDIKLLIIGDGEEKIREKFFHQVKIRELQNNIVYKGLITSSDKYTYLQKARIFLMPSLYESFGLVNIEAMSCELPVVAYNLPVYIPFSKGMIKVPLLDNNAFASEIINLLNNGDYYKKISKEAKIFSSEFSWEKTGEEILTLIKND